VARVFTTDDFSAGTRCLRLLWYRAHDPARADSVPSLYRAYQNDQYTRLLAVDGAAGEPVVRRHPVDSDWVAEARAERVKTEGETATLSLLRPATSVKDSLVWEAAFTSYVFAATGPVPAGVELRYLRKSYRHDATGEYTGLVVSADITRRALGRGEVVGTKLERMMSVLGLSETELLEQTEPCRRRHCPVCAGAASRVDRLARLGPEAELSREQQIHLEAARTGRRHLDPEAIAEFLDGLTYPLCFLDFEAFSEAVPTLDGVAPWEHVPVVYSLHRVERPGARPTHRVYAADPASDGRPALYRDLCAHLGGEGSIVVYGKGFERRMLERLAAAAGRTEIDAPALTERLVDLARLFARCAYYHPAQRGSGSLKSVYRAMIGEDYAGLEVSDGREANVLYYFLRHGFPPGHEMAPRAVLENLTRYCALDTEAMVRIVAHLRGLV
jgi:hypothetical protein